MTIHSLIIVQPHWNKVAADSSTRVNRTSLAQVSVYNINSGAISTTTTKCLVQSIDDDISTFSLKGDACVPSFCIDGLVYDTASPGDGWA
jgi:hypothetical protein